MADVHASAVAHGIAYISNVRCVLREGAQVDGVLFTLPCVITQMRRGVGYPDLYHAQCLPINIAQQGLSIEDAFTALVDTLENLICDYKYDDEALRRKYPCAAHSFYQHLEALKRVCKPWIQRRFG